MREVPLRAEASQKTTISLSGQACQIELRTEIYGLFMDLYVNDDPIILGVICLDRNRIVRDAYLGFEGDFYFRDNKGKSDPVYTGLGGQYSLIYLEPAEAAAFDAAEV